MSCVLIAYCIHDFERKIKRATAGARAGLFSSFHVLKVLKKQRRKGKPVGPFGSTDEKFLRPWCLSRRTAADAVVFFKKTPLGFFFFSALVD